MANGSIGPEAVRSGDVTAGVGAAVQDASGKWSRCGLGSTLRGDRRRRAGEGPVIGRPIRRGDSLAGHLSEGLNFSFQGERLGREAPMLQSVPIASRSAATGAMHPADVTPPNRWRAARLPAPLRSRLASRRLLHIQEHEVVPSIFRLPLPPRPWC